MTLKVCVYPWLIDKIVLPVCLFNLYMLKGNGTPLQYTCLENPMDGEAWWAAVHGIARVGHDRVTSLSLFTHALEKEMATHSSVLA